MLVSRNQVSFELKTTGSGLPVLLKVFAQSPTL